MTRLFLTSLLMFLLGTHLMVQADSQFDINLSGNVTDSNGNAISQAVVSLGKTGISDTTNEEGSFSLVYKAVVGISKDTLSLPKGITTVIHNTKLTIDLPYQSVVFFTTHTLDGKNVSSLKRCLDTGKHTLNLPTSGEGIYFHRTKAGEHEVTFKATPTGLIGHTASHSYLSPLLIDIMDDHLHLSGTGYPNKLCLIQEFWTISGRWPNIYLSLPHFIHNHTSFS